MSSLTDICYIRQPFTCGHKHKTAHLSVNTSHCISLQPIQPVIIQVYG